MPSNALKIFLSACIFYFGFQQTTAQTSYLAEIGVDVGAGSQWGDDILWSQKNIQPLLGMKLKYNFNDRFSVFSTWNTFRIRNQFQNLEYTNSIQMVDLSLSFNFLEFPAMDYKLYSKNFTPYLFGGFGLGLAENSSGILPYFPIGTGMKIQLSERWNLNFQLTHHFYTKNDDLEGSVLFNNPFGMNGTNRYNNDQISTFKVGVSYNFWEKECDCIKQRD